jgi:hypothetical protein
MNQRPTRLRWTIRGRFTGALIGAATGKRHLIASLSAISAISVQLAACGSQQALPSGPHPGSASASASRSTAAGSSKQPLAGSRLATAADARAFARAVNLTAADIPGGSVERRKGNQARLGPAERVELARCERGASRGHRLLETDSPLIKRGNELETEEIRSYVTVLAHGRRAAVELPPLESRGVRECVARVLTRYFADRSVREAHWGRFTISGLPVQAPGADGAIGIRVETTLTLTFSEVTVPIYFDLLGFTSGPAVVSLWAVSVTQPVPAATEQRLLSLLLARAQLHPL